MYLVGLMTKLILPVRLTLTGTNAICFFLFFLFVLLGVKCLFLLIHSTILVIDPLRFTALSFLLTRKSINKEPNTNYKVSAQMHTPHITVSTTTYKRSTFFQLRRRGSTSPNVNQTIHNQVEIPPHSKVPFCFRRLPMVLLCSV